MKSIVVIGGGLSGLTAAAYLSKSGYKVTLIEKNKTLGGRARLLKTNNDFIFDMGPSWYMMPEVIERIFNDLDHKTSDFYNLKELKTKYRVFKDDKSYIDIVSDLEKNLKNFNKISSEDSQNIKKILQKTEKAYTIAVDHFLQKPVHTPLNFFNTEDIFKGIKLLTLLNPFQSYHDYIKKHIKNPDLQKIFEFHTVFLGGSPYSTPALYSILIAADFYKKIWYPMGGMIQLVNALEKICLENNVQIIKGSEVTKMLINKDSYAQGVLVNKKKIKADIIISSADYAHTQLNLINEHKREYNKEYWEKQNYSISSILCFIGLNKKLKNVSHHNFYFQKNWQNHFNTIEKTRNLPKEPNFYLSVPSQTDQTLASKGHETLFLLIPISVKSNDKNIQGYIKNVLTHVENKIGEKFVDNVIYQKIYSKNDFSKDYNAYKGNALGLAHTLKQSVFLRPRMKSKKIKNLFYVGQFTQPGVGVPTVMLSGKYIHDLIKEIYA